MKNIRIPLDRFDGGLNEVARPNILGQSEVQTCENYEIRQPGQLHRRTEPDTYSSGLNTRLAAIFDTVLVMSEPYYPETLKTDMTGDFILFFFGEKAGAYLLYAFYEEAAGWTETVITIDGVTYTSESDMWVTIGEDRVLFTDGINPAHYYLINYDGDAVSGKLGIPAPLNKASVTQITSWDAQDWEENADNAYMSAPGLVQCLYTAVTKDGEESNPSPLSETLDMQFFKLLAGDDARWINKVNISNLIVPNVSSDIMDKLKYFNIYYRVIRYSEGKAPVALQFGQQFEIIDKTSTGLTTGNSYTLTVEASLGEYASYENDVAPVARYAVQNAGVITLANVKKKIRFPWDFEYSCEIKLNNLDSKTYVDAVVKIRLYGTGAASPIDNFLINDFASTILRRHQRIRMFDTDITTPLSIVVNGWSLGSYYMDVFVKIPQLEAGASHSIYLCWTTEANEANYSYVPVVYQVAEYGRFIDAALWWAEQTVFTNEKVFDVNTLILSPCNVEVVSDEVINKANDSDEEDTGHYIYRGELIGGASWDSSPIAAIPELGSGYTIGEKSIDAITASGEYLKYFTLGLTEIPGSGCVGMRLKHTGLQAVSRQLIYISIDGVSLKGFALAIHYNAPDYTWAFYDVDTTTYTDLSITAPTTNGNYFLMISWNGSKISVFIHNYTTFEYEEITQAITIGTLDNINFSTPGSTAANIDQVFFKKNVYYSAGGANDIITVRNIANFMPAMETIVGYDYSTYNNNITFEDSKLIELKEYKNMIVWSDINGVNFPDLYFKRVTEPINAIISAPSFLKYQYENTNIIFTRNTISRFILSGTPDGWRAQTESLVGEYKQVALLANKTLVKWKDTLFWLSESGAIMWSPEGLKLISKNRIEIEIDEDAIAFFSPIRNQYIVSDGGLSRTYNY
uniref:Uncharacterized protein n=2 Tax=viral metagenome TaxID=1070528 RepID=A0A6M3XMW2_9ZZZZ